MSARLPDRVKTKLPSIAFQETPSTYSLVSVEPIDKVPPD